MIGNCSWRIKTINVQESSATSELFEIMLTFMAITNINLGKKSECLSKCATSVVHLTVPFLLLCRTKHGKMSA